MKIQKSYKNEEPKLYIVPTPIGNLKDITIRALEVLNQVEYVFCEDTRNTRKLLNHYEISSQLLPFHEFSNESQINQFKKIIQNTSAAYVSDAGMPGISDPAFDLIKICEEQNIEVVILPGPTAFILPLVRSNYSSGNFTFYGFLDAKDSKRKKQLIDIIDKQEVAIIYEAKHRFLKTLNLLCEIDSNIEINVGRELTKIHEEYRQGKVKDIIDSYEESPKGEFVIVIKQFVKTNDLTIEQYFEEQIKNGLNKKEAIKSTAKKYNLPKNDVYQMFIGMDI